MIGWLIVNGSNKR